jgi:uncharacterized membrane protein
MIFAGFSHLFWARETFRAQVPRSVPLDPDGVMASGGVEIMLGAGLAVLSRDRVLVGRLVAAFFVAVFPATWPSSSANAMVSVSTPTRAGSCVCSSSRCW